MTRARLVPYAPVSWLAMAPGTLLYVAAGALSGELFSGARAGWTAVGLIATAALAWLLVRGARAALRPAGG